MRLVAAAEWPREPSGFTCHVMDGEQRLRDRSVMPVHQDSLATRAFAAFRSAIEDGDVVPFTRLAAAEFSFMVPLPFPDWKDEQHGTDRFAELVRLEREIVALRVRLTPIASLENGDEAVVIFRPEGTLRAAAYSNELAIRFEFEGGRVRRFKEYLGTIVAPSPQEPSG